MSKFCNYFALHHAPHSVFDCALWWKSILSTPGGSRSLIPHCAIDPDIWVNASSSWGIGLVVGKRWSAWHLLPGWNLNDRDIGWAESVALKLAVLWLVEQKYSDCEITVRGDKTGVIGAFNKACSHNTSQNAMIHRIASCLIPFNTSIVLVYVTSLENRADSVSHSILGPQ